MTSEKQKIDTQSPVKKEPAAKATAATTKPGEDQKQAREHGGPSGPEPTRYGDWERNGKCVDF